MGGVDDERMLRDERGFVRMSLRDPRNAARPDAVLHLRRRCDEVEWPTPPTDERRGILLDPSVVVLGDREQNPVAPRMPGETVWLPDLHNPRGERRVIGLRDELIGMTVLSNDHKPVVLQGADS